MKYLIAIIALSATGCINSPLHFNPRASLNLSLYSRSSDVSAATTSDEAESLRESGILTEGGGRVDSRVQSREGQ
jgi:hypothetical protein